jgi:F0F1-type ATP synthase assembly protein I
MSKRKAKKNSERGTYALCITTGVILVGLGLGPLLGSVLASSAIGVLASSAIGVLVGVAAGYFIINRKSGK